MPPQSLNRLSPSSLSSQTLVRGIKIAFLGLVLVLTGCATTSGDYAQADDYRQDRDRYLSQTQADPLGAYLASRELLGSKESRAQSPKALAKTALGFLGTKYRYGGDAPSTGFDCSGLVAYVAEKSLGLKLPRTSAEMAGEGKSVKLGELKQGDLVFFNTRGRRFSHVGIYLGDRKFVHAPRSGSVVRVESMDVAYWRKRYNGARRLASAASLPGHASQ